MSDIQQTMKSYFQQIKSQWLRTEDHFPSLPVISQEKKVKNQRDIEDMTGFFQKQIKHMPRLSFQKKRWANNISNQINDMLHQEELIGIHNVLTQDAVDTWQEELKEFLRLTRKVFPRFTFEETGQGIRNYIVYKMISELCGVSRDFCKAAYGYSMLYPVTDNYIDSNRSFDEKAEYNQYIKEHIEGKDPDPKDEHQLETGMLLDAIQSEFPRKENKELYALLLLMLDAQATCLKQQNVHEKLSIDDRLNISIYKGGTSVLFDRFLVRKQVTESDFLSYIGLGFFLQLADDLQDIKEDGERGHHTIFTYRKDSDYLEKTVNKLLQYIRHVLEKLQTSNQPFKEFLLFNCYHLVYLSVIMSKEFFTQEYLDCMENYLLISLSSFDTLLNQRPENMEEADQEKYMEMLDAILFLV